MPSGDATGSDTLSVYGQSVAPGGGGLDVDHLPTPGEDGVAEGEDDDSVEDQYLVWTGPGKRTPVILFKPEAILIRNPTAKAIGAKYHLAYKMVKTECKIIRAIVTAHGFHEVHPNSLDFNLMWTGCHLKPYVLRSFTEFQKVNHFPRSYEVTRKDRLYKNVQRMQQIKGMKHFDFIPASFVLPVEFQEFQAAFVKDKGPWIVKPVASSRGRGIYLINHPSQAQSDETLLVAKYINNPLLVDDFKFDLRLYVAVTSYDPLIVYLYEEGLARFATVKYDRTCKNIRNQCMHLTNYSVNKKSSDYVRCEDPDLEDYGNKWSMSALLRFLRHTGKDTTGLMMRVEDLVIKTFISAEVPIATACNMFMPHRGNCFELYGFDVLIDENLKPWLLEVNLSPSLACDAPIDLKIKASLCSDLFSLTGVIAQDPMMRRVQQSKRNYEASVRRKRPHSAGITRCQSTLSGGGRPGSGQGARKPDPSTSGLTVEENKILRLSKEEFQRRGGFLRIIPSENSWELYGSLMEHKTTHNYMLHTRLYPDKLKVHQQKPSTAPLTSATARTKNLISASYVHQQLQLGPLNECADAQANERIVQYERKLTMTELKTKKSKELNKNKNAVFPAGLTVLLKERESAGLVQGQLVQTDDDDAETVAGDNVGVATETVVEDVVDAVDENNNDESKPWRLNVSEFLDNGGNLSKTQARHAFAAYLKRVQKRLIHESATDTSVEDDQEPGQHDEQMELVLRFLKRAAINLQQPFRVVVPSRKLPVYDRRRILAKQLGDFVHIYSRETDHFHSKAEDKIAGDQEVLDAIQFHHFITKADENALEEVLTIFTRLNKSASIFLGGSNNNGGSKQLASSNHDGDQSNATASGNHGDTLRTQSNGIPNSVHRNIEAYHVKSGSNIISTSVVSLYSSQSTPGVQGGGEPPPRPASSAESRPHGSVPGSLVMPSSSGGGIKSRPYSAVPIGRTQLNSTGYAKLSRPLSANAHHDAMMSRLYSDRTAAIKSCYEHSEQAISQALHRLAKRQAARQYAATNSHNSLIQQYTPVTPAAVHKTDPLTPAPARGPADLARSQSMIQINGTVKPQHQHSQNNSTTLSSSPAGGLQQGVLQNEGGGGTEGGSGPGARRASSMDSVLHSSGNNVVTGGRRSSQDGACVTLEEPVSNAAVYTTVTGVMPQNHYHPTPGSSQYQLLQRKQSIESISGPYSMFTIAPSKPPVPKPPGNPIRSRRPVSSQRLARTCITGDNLAVAQSVYDHMKYTAEIAVKPK